jgi:hypothetical protein
LDGILLAEPAYFSIRQGGAIGIPGKRQNEAEKMGLKETLADLTAVGEKERQRREDAPQKLLAWLKEIDDLHAWVKDNLSEHASLRYGTKPIQLAEDQLGGRYEANILLISAGSEERPVVVALEPVASLSMGAEGVIEMYRVDRSGRKTRLFRAKNGEKSVGWYIGDREKHTLLSKQSLEVQLDLLFKA